MDKIEVTQADRDAAASLMSDVGLFSNVLTAKAVQAFARHRLATRTDATPVAWEWRVKGTTDWIMQRAYPNRANDRTDIERRALYTHPPATDVAALVEAAKDALPFMTQLRAGICLKTDGKIVSADSAYQNLYAAIAPFTKGQNDE